MTAVVRLTFLDTLFGATRLWGASVLFVVAMGLFGFALYSLLVEVGVAFGEFHKLETGSQPEAKTETTQ